MTIENLIEKASQAVTIYEVAPMLWKLESEATFLNGNEILVYLKKENDKWLLTDEKETLKYMHEFYELKSNDVKMCISNILKIYGFTITGGKLLAQIMDESTFMDKYFDFIMCVGQLANMFAFFDKPE
jgi:DNA-directed RNA polymerase subunit F